MIVKMEQKLILLGLVVIVCLIRTGFANENARRQNRREGRNRQMRDLEVKLAATQSQLATIREQIKQIEAKVQDIPSEPLGPGPAYPTFDLSDRLIGLPACPEAHGFYYVQELQSCYRLEPRNVLVNWTEAVSICRGHDSAAHLVSIESEAEQQFLQRMWQTERGIGTLSRFWTSGRRQGGSWVWEANNRRFRFNYWIPTTPHDDDRFSCMSIQSTEAYNWGDVACWAPHLVTCELPARR